MAIALQESDIARALTRVAHEIIERNSGTQSITLLGIPTRGAHLAHRLAEILNRINDETGLDPVQVGTLDVTLHRDDLRTRAPRALMPTTIPSGGVEGRVVVLVDDVLFSGRTIRSALDAIGEIGRPAKVQLAVLVDRGHRELPIKADYVGKNLPTAIHQSVKVHLSEIDGNDEVIIEGDAS